MSIRFEVESLTFEGNMIVNLSMPKINPANSSRFLGRYKAARASFELPLLHNALMPYTMASVHCPGISYRLIISYIQLHTLSGQPNQ